MLLHMWFELYAVVIPEELYLESVRFARYRTVTSLSEEKKSSNFM